MKSSAAKTRKDRRSDYMRPGLFSLRTVGSRHADGPIYTIDRDAQEPRVAAHLAVLHERARDVHVDVDLDVLSAVRARDEILLDA